MLLTPGDSLHRHDPGQGTALILAGDDQVVARMAANDRQRRRYSGAAGLRLARGGPERRREPWPCPNFF
ncbi:MAG: hypothetical protein ACLT9P_02325 [Evtepia gabavorous]